MKYNNIILVIIAIVVSNNAKADSWTVIQTTTITMNQLSLTQDATTASTQAVNHINLNMTNGEIRGTQTFNGSGKNIVFVQNNTTNSRQAINRISAATVTSATQTVTANSISFNQNDSGTGNNIQAGNLIETNSFTTGGISQSLNVNTINFKVNGSEAENMTDNIQAANVIITGSGNSQNVQTSTVSIVTSSSSNSSLNYFKLK